ncbi:FUT-1 [Mytilus edulis]|uniref:Fucosyltransferase n=1 Tax=Mytilus edulis TaxID=6550 RepID=A0A8S3S8L5_MYTED|nr:FUT-1 [Mytilus edulis]
MNIKVPNKIPGLIWVFMSYESEAHTLKHFLKKEWDNKFDWVFSYRSDADISFPYGVLHRRNIQNDKNYTSLFQKKSKSVAWVVSNCKSDSHRYKYIKKMMQSIQIDVYGKCGKTCSSSWNSDKCFNDLSKDYKFYLAFENSICKDYVSEKVFRLYQDGFDFIPVYRGAMNIKDILPNGTFISSFDFSSALELALYLKNVGSNESAYTNYLKAKDKFFSNGYTRQEVLQFMYCSVCEKLNNNCKSGEAIHLLQNTSSYNEGERANSRSYNGGERANSSSYNGGERANSRSYNGGERVNSSSYNGVSEPILVHTTEVSKPILVHTTEGSEPILVHTMEVSEPILVHTTEVSEPILVHTTEVSEPILVHTTEVSEPILVHTTDSYNGGERANSSSYNAGVRANSSSYNGGERANSSSYNGGERANSRSYNGGERANSRSYNGGERANSSSYNGGERANLVHTTEVSELILVHTTEVSEPILVHTTENENNLAIVSNQKLSSAWAHMPLRRIQYKCPVPEGNIWIDHVSIVNDLNATCPEDLSYFVKVSLPLMSKGSNIAICSLISYRSQDAALLVEWFEAQRLLGVNKIVTYTQDLNSDAIRVLDYYESIGLVHVIHEFDMPKKDEFPRFIGEQNIRQWTDKEVVTLDCNSRLLQFKYVIMCDKDEFLVPNITKFGFSLRKALDHMFDDSTAGFQLNPKLHITTWTPYNRSSTLFISKYLNSTSSVPDRHKYVYMPERVVIGSTNIHEFTACEGYKM